MIENYATELAIQQATGSPAGLMTGAYRIHGTNAMVRTQAIASLTRKDPWRSSADTIPILIEPAVAWACDVGDQDATEVIFDALGDPTRATDVAGVRTWRLGRASSVRRFDFHAATTEGANVRVKDMGLTSAQLVIERGNIANWMTEWAGWSIDDTDPAWTTTDLGNETYATAPTTIVTIDGAGYKVFAAAVSISRPMVPANFSQAGSAQAWAGGLAFDVVGRLALRFDPGDFEDLIQGEIQTREIVIEMTAGSRVRTLALPSCAVEMRDRRLIGPGTYEHLVDFAVLREEGQDVMTMTSEETP